MKQRLRGEVLELRQNISPGQGQDHSRRIKERLLQWEAFEQAVNIMAYVAFRNEVETLPLIEHCLSTGKRVVVPVCIKETRRLLLSELKDPKKELGSGTYNVPEPLREYLRPFPREELDIVLVPGVAFDRLGFRLGYGGGYYDRFFDELKKLREDIPSVGLAYGCQIIHRVPVEPTDWPVDFIITEGEFINCIEERNT